MRTEKITPDRVPYYPSLIPESFMPSIQSGRMEAIGGLFSDNKAGAVVWEEKGDVRILRSLYVLPEYRRLGVGSELLRKAAQKNMVFSYEATDERAMFEPFFEYNNIFFERQDYPVGIITIKDAKESLTNKKVDKLPMAGMFYEELLREEKLEAAKWLMDNFGQEMTPYTTLNPSSVFLVDKSDVKSALLFSKAEKGNIGIDYVFCIKGDEALLGGMMHKAMNLIIRQYKLDTELVMMMTTEQGMAMFKGLFGEPTGSVAVINGTIDAEEFGNLDDKWD